MVENCGDDLVAARRFMNLCRGHMSEMFSGGKLPMEDVVARLSEIQDQAKKMQAKYIYNSAQTVINDLTERRTPGACTSSVLVLQKLIQQYDSGLTELAPASTRTTEPEKTNPVGPIVISELTRQIESAKILAPLIKFADQDDREGLIKLVSLAANRSHKPAKPDYESFDVIVPALTNRWLRDARTQGKSISISSGCDAALVKADVLNKVQSFLHGLGEILISRSVEVPEKLEARGLSRSAHMAVTARLSQKSLTVLLTCRGRDVDSDLIEDISRDIRAAGFSPFLDLQGDIIRFEIRNIPARPSMAPEREAAS